MTYIVTPNADNPMDIPHYRWLAYPEGSFVEDTARYGATPEQAFLSLVDAPTSDFPVEDVVRVLEDVSAFLARFKGSNVKETIYLSQLVANVLVKVKQVENV